MKFICPECGCDKLEMVSHCVVKTEVNDVTEDDIERGEQTDERELSRHFHCEAHGHRILHVDSYEQLYTWLKDRNMVMVDEEN
jgi:hypothetical protein